MRFPMANQLAVIFLFNILLLTLSSAFDASVNDDSENYDRLVSGSSRRVLLSLPRELTKKNNRRDNETTTGYVVDGITEVNNDKKKKLQRRSCCGENDDLKLLWGEGVRDVKKECFDQAKRATEATRKGRMEVEEYEGFIHGNRTKDEYICTVQCIGQKKEVLDRMGNVKKEEMGEYVKKTYSNEPWKAEIADTVLEKCFSETQRPSEGEVSTDNGAVTNGRSVQAKCNSNGIAFIHCLWREMQLNCPADKLRDSRKCNKLRDRLRLRESAVKNGDLRSLF